MCPAFFFGEQGVGHDDDDIARLGETGGGAVEADDAGAAGAGYGVGFEAGAVVVVDDLYPFIGQDAGFFHQFFINGDAAHIGKIGFGNGSAVNFSFEHI